MFTQKFLLLTFIATILLLQINHCFCINSELSVNASAAFFAPAVATWYGSPTGAGSGGACGLENDVANGPYYGLISAGNQNLFKSGKGCGSCYQVKCTQNPACSGFPITVTITDECPGTCNNDRIHFDLSGKAFGFLAKPGQGDALRKAGRIAIDYQRVPCFYKGANILLKVDRKANPFYLAFAFENVNGDGDIGFAELLPSNSKTWIPMKQVFGATYEAGIPSGIRGPYSVRITTIESRKQVTAFNVIPANWAPGKYYQSNVNF